jgi:transaldolase
VTRIQQLFHEQGQSPWLDNLTRSYLRDGTLVRMVLDGIRGVTANPTIFAKAIEGSDAYDEQFASLTSQGRSVTDAYWDMVVDDVRDALRVLRPVFDVSGGTDGFVSIEVAPELARDTHATIAAARDLHARIDQPNLFVKIPATAQGVPAIQAMTAEGHNINVTLIFSLARYQQSPSPPTSQAHGVCRGWRRHQHRAQCGVVFRQPRRHRSQPAPRCHRRTGRTCAAR